jgi:hypothetical protein
MTKSMLHFFVGTILEREKTSVTSENNSTAFLVSEF